MVDWEGVKWSSVIWLPVIVGILIIIIRCIPFVWSGITKIRSGDIDASRRNIHALLMAAIVLLLTGIALRYTWSNMIQMVFDDMAVSGDQVHCSSSHTCIGWISPQSLWDGSPCIHKTSLFVLDSFSSPISASTYISFAVLWSTCLLCLSLSPSLSLSMPTLFFSHLLNGLLKDRSGIVFIVWYLKLIRWLHFILYNGGLLHR